MDITHFIQAVSVLVFSVGPLRTRQQNCINNEVRIFELDTGHFLDYCINGQWKRICTGGGSFNNNEATVACRQLGYKGYKSHEPKCSKSRPPGYFKFKSSCNGREKSIQQCGGVNTVDRDSCNKCQKSGRYFGNLVCEKSDCTDGDVRLVDGESSKSGRVEVCKDGAWGTVCKSDNKNKIADKVCTIIVTKAESSGQIISVSPGYVPIRSCALSSSGNLLCETATDTSCSHSKDLGVSCHVINPPSPVTSHPKPPKTEPPTSTNTENETNQVKITTESDLTDPMRTSTRSTEYISNSTTEINNLKMTTELLPIILGSCGSVGGLFLITAAITLSVICLYIKKNRNEVIEGGGETPHLVEHPIIITQNESYGVAEEDEVIYDNIDYQSMESSDSSVSDDEVGLITVRNQESRRSRRTHFVTNQSYGVIDN